jgi:hypothetical protein
MAACHSLLRVDGWYGSPASLHFDRVLGLACDVHLDAAEHTRENQCGGADLGE